MQSEICYCAVKREKIKGKWKYYIQITLKGHVPDKFDKQTGELKRQLGKGNVGLYFTSTSLTVSTEDGVKTYPLEIKNHEDKKLNCCRRWMYPDVQQIRTTTMKMEPVRKKMISNDGIFQKLIKKYRNELYDIYSKECEEKKLLQEILANGVIASEDVFNCNKMDFKFLQRNMGRKIQSASPAMLKITIERKLSYHDVSINEISYTKLNPVFKEKM